MKTSREDRVDLFDRWAETYDRSVGADSFPLAGYDDILDTIVRLAEIEPDHCSLDVGIGTGALAERIAASGCALWGIDFSEEMLKRARAKLPAARLLRANLLESWPEGLPNRFDRVVSAYVFHEFADGVKVRLIEDLAGRVALDGRIVIGDVAFPDARALDECRRAWRTAWDEAEHYWTAESMQRVLEDAGFAVKYEQVSFCGGVFSLQRVAVS